MKCEEFKVECKRDNWSFIGGYKGEEGPLSTNNLDGTRWK